MNDLSFVWKEQDIKPKEHGAWYSIYDANNAAKAGQLVFKPNPNYKPKLKKER